MKSGSVSKAALRLVGLARLAEYARRAAQQASPTFDMTAVSNFISIF